jgi:hypothetical protein
VLCISESQRNRSPKKSELFELSFAWIAKSPTGTGGLAGAANRPDGVTTPLGLEIQVNSKREQQNQRFIESVRRPRRVAIVLRNFLVRSEKGTQKEDQEAQARAYRKGLPGPKDVGCSSFAGLHTGIRDGVHLRPENISGDYSVRSGNNPGIQR